MMIASTPTATTPSAAAAALGGMASGTTADGFAQSLQAATAGTPPTALVAPAAQPHVGSPIVPSLAATAPPAPILQAVPETQAQPASSAEAAAPPTTPQPQTVPAALQAEAELAAASPIASPIAQQPSPATGEAPAAIAEARPQPATVEAPSAPLAAQPEKSAATAGPQVQLRPAAPTDAEAPQLVSPSADIEPAASAQTQAQAPVAAPAAGASTVAEQAVQPIAARREPVGEAAPKKSGKAVASLPASGAAAAPIEGTSVDAQPDAVAAVASLPLTNRAPKQEAADESSFAQQDASPAAAATPNAEIVQPARIADNADAKAALAAGPSRSIAAVADGSTPAPSVNAEPAAARTADRAETATFALSADDAAPMPDTDGLPTPLLGQTLAPSPNRPANAQLVYAAQQIAQQPQPGTVTAQPGRFGRDMGVEIARRLSAGQEEMLVRLNPQEMGRIDVRVSFDDSGTVRAVLATDSPAALDLLRRESGDLVRSLADAGVRSDSQSFRFDRGGTDGGSQRGQNGSGNGSHQQSRQDARFENAAADTEHDNIAYRQLRSSGQVDVIA
ncbi:flagellar hook-length control protein FliK [Sphingosinicella sp. BN140058]|uniref:flagellar hook-length control protein FliK n=1 Tax=Sphingosinicella sp. BN140058 TaxID=1892855 RepID=UPI0013EC370D|nr:flagellar hook-length control protein FliK [Sphingosinicella sp. BN140058]